MWWDAGSSSFVSRLLSMKIGVVGCFFLRRTLKGAFNSIVDRCACYKQELGTLTQQGNMLATKLERSLHSASAVLFDLKRNTDNKNRPALSALHTINWLFVPYISARRHSRWDGLLRRVCASEVFYQHDSNLCLRSHWHGCLHVDITDLLCCTARYCWGIDLSFRFY